MLASISIFSKSWHIQTVDAGPTDGSLAVDALAGLLFLGPDGHLGLDGDGHCLLSGELNRRGDIYGDGVPLALFLLL